MIEAGAASLRAVEGTSLTVESVQQTRDQVGMGWVTMINRAERDVCVDYDAACFVNNATKIEKYHKL
jgi:hypothetical protein